MKKCRACGEGFESGYEWRTHHQSISLPKPPSDLNGAYICASCYKDGLTMESRIRNFGKSPVSIVTRVMMPNGQAGCLCATCNGFYPYAEPNRPDGSFRCVEHR